MNRLDAFRHLNAEPRNNAWAWSARTPDGKVVVTLWEAFVHTDVNGWKSYIFPPLPPEKRKRLGFRQLMRDLEHAIANHNGTFGVVISRAMDMRANVRKIDTTYPCRFLMRITSFDRETGAFTAEQVKPQARTA
jgi:hypothetical protein